VANDLIPEDVEQFILDNIDSVAQLEGLLLLRSSPEAQWYVESVSTRLYINEQEAVEILEHLNILGLVQIQKAKPPTYQYQPDSADLTHMVDRLAETYRKYLVPVTNLIHSKAQTRVQQFADAFKIKRRKK
jgi:hypothetical protein